MLTHLDLSCNDIRAAGAESLVGVLGQCTILAHLDLRVNGGKSLRESLYYKESEEESDLEDPEDSDEEEDEDDPLED